jgi:hypothetical protein
VTPVATTGERSVPRRRWGIALLLGFGVLVNYFDRVNLSVSQEALHNAFGISTVTFGYLLSAYSWIYAAFQLPSGLILDRFGVKLVGRIGALLWSVASFAAAISTGLAAFLGRVFLLGIGESPTFPANAKAIGIGSPRKNGAWRRQFLIPRQSSPRSLACLCSGCCCCGLDGDGVSPQKAFSACSILLFFMYSTGIPAKTNRSAAERDFIRNG